MFTIMVPHLQPDDFVSLLGSGSLITVWFATDIGSLAFMFLPMFYWSISGFYICLLAFCNWSPQVPSILGQFCCVECSRVLLSEASTVKLFYLSVNRF